MQVVSSLEVSDREIKYCIRIIQIDCIKVIGTSDKLCMSQDEHHTVHDNLHHEALFPTFTVHCLIETMKTIDHVVGYSAHNHLLLQ